MKNLISNPFQLDIRALGLFRIFLGLVVILDLMIRMEDLQAHYTNQGVLPIPALILNNWVDQYFSLHMATGNYFLILILFLLSIVAAVVFTIGLHTRLFTFIVWLLLVSVQSRNPYIEQGGDDLLRIMLFWGFFLPLGACFSVDSKRNNYIFRSYRYFNLANVGLIMLLFSVYFFSSQLKTGAEWRTEGTAIYYALSLNQIQLPLGKVLLQFPELCRLLTLSVFYLELIVPFLLLIPVFPGFFRWIFIGVMAALHVGIGSTLYVGLFYIINLVSLVALLPTSFFGENRRWISAIDLWFEKLYLVLKDLKTKSGLSWSIKLPTINIESSVVGSLCIFLIVYCFLWNLGGISNYGLNSNFKKPGYFLRLDQAWGMFSPTVFKDDGWYIHEATFADNTQTDLKTMKAISYAKPAYVLGGIKNDRWRKYLENYLFVSNANMRPYFCHFLLDRWREEHPDKPIRKLEIIYMKEVTPPPGKTGKVTREVLCSCQ